MRALLAAFTLMFMVSQRAPAGVPVECGEWPSKAPWEWTDEERLDRRFDERCLQARRAEAARPNRLDGFCRASGTIDDFVFGSDTPELFLPWQLFDTLLSRVSEPRLANFGRQTIEKRMLAAEDAMPEDFWRRVEDASGEYLQLLRAQRGMAARLDGASPAERRVIQREIEESQRANCGARHAALRRVRAEFGTNLFDRLLYVAVAPGICVSGASERKILEWVGLGCPPN